MEVLLSGLSRRASIIQVETLDRFKWEDVSGILSIPGVDYYYIEPGVVSVTGVRYSKPVEAKDVAAQILVVLAGVMGVPVEKLIVLVKDGFSIEVNRNLAEDVRRRACAATTPEQVPPHQVEARGQGRVPFYWLSA